MVNVQLKWPLCKKKCTVGFSMLLQSQGMIEDRICEGTDCLKASLSSDLTGLQVIVCLRNKCELW